MFYNLNIEEQLRNIMQKFCYSELGRSSQNENELTDFVDGKLYKKLLESEDGAAFKNKEAFSFLTNTDGISFCSKSNLLKRRRKISCSLPKIYSKQLINF